MGDLQGALEDFDQACNLDKLEAWTWKLRGLLKLEMGDYQGPRAGLEASNRQKAGTVTRNFLEGAITGHLNWLES